MDVVATELKSLGAKEVEPGYKAVRFTATREKAYEIALKCATASRLLQVIRESAASNPIMLTSQAKRVRWDEYIRPTMTYLIEGVAGDRGEGAMTSNEISKAVRLGLQETFIQRKAQVPRVDLKEPDVVLVAFVYRKRLTLSIDFSGKTMHKRGYRLEGHPAPLKETMAASLLLMAGYDGSQLLLDPMCGSGTISVEAAYIALEKAPLIHRVKGDFGFEHTVDFDRQLWRDVQERVRAERREEPAQPIYARDISEKYLEMARKNALRARVEKHITFECGSFFDLPAPAPSGILIANLPYGERIKGGADEDLQGFYKEIGDTLKKRYQGWTAWLLASEEAPYKFIGLKPSRRISVLNGSIPCKFLKFELYAGTKSKKS